MRQAGRKIPDVAALDVCNLWAALLVEHCNSALAVEHQGPFRLLMPVQFAYAETPQPHVHAGNIRRNREIFLRYFTGPTAALIALMRIVERRPEDRHTVDVRRRRILERWE